MLEIWLDRLLGVLGAVFLFGFAVLVHELGHFIMARLCGVGVRKFAIGFGPKIWAVTRGGTEYSVRWLPFGGFVALKGMIEGLDEEPDQRTPSAAPERRNAAGQSDGRGSQTPPDLANENGAQPGAADTPPAKADQLTDLVRGMEAASQPAVSVTADLDALRSKSPLTRIAVFGAGVTCNFLSAILFMAVLLWYGQLESVDLPNAIGDIPEDSPWRRAGWRSGDKILKVEPVSWDPSASPRQKGNNSVPTRKEMSTYDDVMDAIRIYFPPPPRFRTWGYIERELLGVSATPTTVTLRITVERDGRQLALPWSTAWQKTDPFERLFTTIPYIGAISPSSPADRARLVKITYTEGEIIRPYPTWEEMKPCPLEPDDLILAVNHQPVRTWNEMARLLQAHPNEPVTLTVRRRKENQILLLATELERADEDPAKGRLGIQSGTPFKDERKRLPLVQALARAPMETLVYADLILSETVRFFAVQSRREIKRNLSGPMGIVILAYKSAQQGLNHYLTLFIGISIILTILNLLPIPVLDGGYILITLIEALIRRPIPHRILTTVLTVFTVLFLLLFGFLTYNDLMNWVFKL